MTPSQPKLAEVRERGQMGTVGITLIEIAGGRNWALALTDKFKISTSWNLGGKRPPEDIIARLVALHVRISMVKTGRN